MTGENKVNSHSVQLKFSWVCKLEWSLQKKSAVCTLLSLIRVIHINIIIMKIYKFHIYIAISYISISSEVLARS